MLSKQNPKNNPKNDQRSLRVERRRPSHRSMVTLDGNQPVIVVTWQSSAPTSPPQVSRNYLRVGRVSARSSTTHHSIWFIG